MFWFLAIIGLIILALRFPKFGVAVLIVVVAVALFLFVYFEHQHEQREAAKHLVNANQLDFMDMRMGPGGIGSNYALTGRIKNNSSYQVTDIRLKLDIQDCASDGHCDTVGEQEQTLYPSIPPGQVRDVNDTAYFSDIKIQGTYKWSYSVEEIDAATPE